MCSGASTSTGSSKKVNQSLETVAGAFASAPAASSAATTGAAEATSPLPP